MNRELFARCLPIQIRRPNPYVTCPSRLGFGPGKNSSPTSEFVGIITEYRTSWNEHAVIPVVFCRLVRQSAFGGRSSAEDFRVFDDGAHVRKLWSTCECRESYTADHGIKFGLRSALHFGECTTSVCLK